MDEIFLLPLRLYFKVVDATGSPSGVTTSSRESRR